MYVSRKYNFFTELIYSHYTIVYNLKVLHWMKWQKKPLIGWLGDTETASIMLHLFCSSGGFISHRICIISGLETIFLLAPEMRQYRETGTHFSLSHSHKIFIIKRQKYLLYQISKYLKWTKTLQYFSVILCSIQVFLSSGMWLWQYGTHLTDYAFVREQE